MRQADIKSGRTYINWPETATRTVTSIRGAIIYFSEVRHDWPPPRDRCRFERFAGGPSGRWISLCRSAGSDRFQSCERLRPSSTAMRIRPSIPTTKAGRKPSSAADKSADQRARHYGRGFWPSDDAVNDVDGVN